MSGQYADRYVQPLTNTFGANMHGGLFRTADVGNGFLPLLPVNVYVGFNVSSTLTASLNKTFTLEQGIPIETSEPGTEAELVLNGPARTVAGKTSPADGTLDLVFRRNGTEVGREQLGPGVQGLLDERVPLVPLPMPQVSVGSLFGTEAQLRYFPKSNLCYGGGCYGQVGLFGLAVRHDIDQWIPVPLPLNIAVQGSWNQFSIANEFEGETEKVFDASGWAANVQVSKGIPILPVVVYGGLQYEQFNAAYDYTFDLGRDDLEPISVSLDQTAANQFRGLVGLSVDVFFVRINADYAIGSDQNVLTTGIGVRL